MAQRPTTLVPLNLAQYLEVSRCRFDAHLTAVDEPAAAAGMEVTARFHYVKFDSNGEPKFRDLAECLADHITQYCFSARRRQGALTEADRNRLYREAKGLFRKLATSGELGELLLYFLVEAVLQAPQMVAKMDLKTAAGLESHGCDGVHMRWHPEDGLLDVYFGEAKLHASASGALSDAFASLSRFHEKHLEAREFGIVTSHYKWADDDTRRLVLRYVDRQDPLPDARINHACLIGYDWAAYKKLDGNERGEFVRDFMNLYRAEGASLTARLEREIAGFKFKQFRVEVFFLPFKSVQEFRDAFYEAI